MRSLILSIFCHSREIFCHSREGGNPVLFKATKNSDWILAFVRITANQGRHLDDPKYPSGSIWSLFKKFLVASFLCLIVSSAFADFPVIDPTSIVQELQMVTKLEAEIAQLKNLKLLAKKQINAMTGGNGFGKISGFNKMTWTPQWSDALSGQSQSTNSTFTKVMKSYSKKYGIQDASSYAAGASKKLSENYQHQVNVNRASLATATAAFNNINTHLATLKKYGVQIGSGSANTLKSAVDLNSRIQLEQAFLAVAELRMQALMNQQMASEQASKIQWESDGSRFNQGGIQKK